VVYSLWFAVATGVKHRNLALGMGRARMLYILYTNRTLFFYCRLPIAYGSLVFSIIDLDPVPVGVAKIELFYPIHAVGDRVLFASPVFEFHVILFEVIHEIAHGSDTEAEMRVFVVRDFGGSAGNNMKMAKGADAEPGMAAIMEGLGNGIETDHLLIKMGTYF
jgi:hypothetical protein